MNFPILYKKTSTGAIQFWEIQSGEYDGIGFINTTYGQVGTDSPQTTSDYIDKGKNVGKKNETTPGQQAEVEARAKWEKQKKKGYVETKKAAEAGELDELIEGGIAPMLAHKFTEQGHKVKYPCYVQPKLDGIRCIAILKDGKCTLWSRTRKLITGVPHIARFIEQNFGGPIIFDGELYRHEYKNDFEQIVSFVRQDEPKEGYEIVQYHVYDLVAEESFDDRTKLLESMLFYSMNNDGPLVEVETVRAENEDDILEWFEKFSSQGYEGCMVRNMDSQYVNKRSYDLLKVKDMLDSEFEIVGIEEGRGKLTGHVGAFICKNEKGYEFKAKMSGDTAKLRKYFLNPAPTIGKLLTVQYQGFTGKNKVPRFPVGIRIRDPEL